MQQVADLLAVAAEADVGERPAEAVREHPVGEDALVDLPHLPRPRDHAAAVDDRPQPERSAYSASSSSAASFVAPYSVRAPAEREVLRDPARGGARQRLLVRELEAGLAPRSSASASAPPPG